MKRKWKWNDVEKTVLAVARKVRSKYPKGKNKGRCLDANEEIITILESKGIVASLQFGTISNKRHCWIEIIPCWLGIDNMPVQYVLDVTLDQFGDQYPAIVWRDIADCPQYVYDCNWTKILPYRYLKYQTPKSRG